VTQFAIIVALGTLAAGLAATFGLRALPTVRLQLAALALLAVALPLAAVTLGGLVMFHMNDDVKLLAVGAASASTALVAAMLLGHSISRRVRSLEHAAARLAAGELTTRAPSDGPREVARLGASFNVMATNIEQLFDARRQLVAWASHDLRTPVAAIQAMLEAIEDGVATQEDYRQALSEQAANLGALIDDLFELAQIDAGALTLELRETPLGELLTSCVRGLEAEARSRAVRLELALEEPLPTVHCAPRHVQRVLLNLLTNALRHTPSDGAVVVTARPVGAELEVLVEDTGEGLTEQAQARMFDRFWREDPARGRTGGRAGLGLAIARGLLEAQGGRIWAENRSSGGARVGFSLPLVAAADGGGSRELPPRALPA
jgi:two-component system, OmpR family, sensor histidine kinase SaeS